MSLIGGLNIGKSALAVQQAAIQVTGNNIANAGNADYTRQVTQLAANKDQQLRPGVFMGTGVDLTGIQRQIDEALQGRLRSSVSDAEAGDTAQQWLGRIESVFNELGSDDLSSRLSSFFNSWSNLANTPQDMGLRQVVVQNGQSVATWINNVRNSLGNLQTDIDSRLTALASNADQLASQVAKLNQQIVINEGGTGGQANALRDQRDAVLGQLSKLMNIKTVPQANGTTDVYIGSQPLVSGTQNFGVSVRQETVNGQLSTKVVFKSNGGEMTLDGSGQLGAMYKVRTEDLQGALTQMDGLAGGLIYELNKVYSSGQGLDGFSSVTATNSVGDSSVALNSDSAGLAFKPNNGSFVVHVKQKGTGLVSSTLVQLDLDGINASSDTSLDSLKADLDNIPDISAKIVGGKLQISADSGAVEVSFSQDSSGVLAALGINSFFTGTNATTIAVNSLVQQQPMLLAAARNGEKGDNQTAVAIAALESQAMDSLKGVNLKDSYQQMINGVAVASDSAKTNAQATQAVRDTLESQREALSGVSLDEEAVNLMRQQRAFQGAAKLITTIDELMKTVMNMT